jgi:hypothetical protein
MTNLQELVIRAIKLGACEQKNGGDYTPSLMRFRKPICQASMPWERVCNFTNPAVFNDV